MVTSIYKDMHLPNAYWISKTVVISLRIFLKVFAQETQKKTKQNKKNKKKSYPLSVRLMLSISLLTPWMNTGRHMALNSPNMWMCLKCTYLNLLYSTSGLGSKVTA